MDTKKEIEKLLDQIVNKTMSMDLTWDWSAGVAYYGVCYAYEYTQNKHYIELLQERMDELINLGFGNDWTVNKCAMGHSLITLYEVTGDEKYWNLVMSKIDYLQHRALRFGENVLQHTVSNHDDFPEQAWADTLFMAAYFMLRVGIIEKDEQLINDALNQYYWHINFLQDANNGLFYHGYSHVSKTNLSSFHWGRANAWAAYTLSQVGNKLPEAYLYPMYMDVQGALTEQLSALKYLQTSNGLWRTILDDETSYEEVSATAGIASAMFVHHNPLHQKYAIKAWEGIKSSILPDGKVNNVSGGTAVMKNAQGYKEISKKWIQGWGQGLVLVYIVELLKTKFDEFEIEEKL